MAQRLSRPDPIHTGPRRVDVAASAQQRRESGKPCQRSGYCEHHHQAVVKRSRNQIREELPAGDGLLSCSRKGCQRSARREQVLQRVHAENCREQRGHRRQGADVMRDAMGHAVALQAAGQRRRQAARQPGDHEREEHSDRQRGA